MVLQILLRRIDFGSFFLVAARRIILAVFVPMATSSTMVIRTHREKNYPCSICHSGYILDNDDSYPRLPINVDQVVSYFALT
jgi:hypothetical protein